MKLSALHPRYEWTHRAEVMDVLVPRARELARAAARAGIGFNIDAEEAERLDLSLDVIEALLRDPELAGWDGFGVVVQAYGRRCGAVIDWLEGSAAGLDRRIMVRLVKGAYWDAEVKQAQEKGLPDFPVFTRKPSTDASYLANARRLLDARGRIYPQFATHNAHTVAAVLEMAGDREGFEFQRLHGMGEALHEIVREREGTRCRIYAPVGAHRDLLAYLVRRLLENGANSSFVNQIVDKRLKPVEIAADPLAAVEDAGRDPEPAHPAAGGAVRAADELARVERERAGVDRGAGRGAGGVAARIAGRRGRRAGKGGAAREVVNPADPADVVGTVREATAADVAAALAAGGGGDGGGRGRAVLERAADLYEENAAELVALATREAGKTLPTPSPRCARRWTSCATMPRQAGGEGRGGDGLHQPLELPAGDLHRAGGGLPRGGERGDRQAGRADAADRGPGGRADARGRGAGGGAPVPAGGRAGGGGAADGGAGDRGRGLHRLDRGGAGRSTGRWRRTPRRTRC